MTRKGHILAGPFDTPPVLTGPCIGYTLESCMPGVPTLHIVNEAHSMQGCKVEDGESGENLQNLKSVYTLV